MDRALGIALACGAAALFATSTARADGDDPTARFARDDLVVLRSGAVLRGRLLERVEGDHLTIRTDAGVVRVVPWSDIDQHPFSEPTSSGPGVSTLEVFGWLGGAVALGGGGMLVGSVFDHGGSRGPLQIAGGVTLGAGLTVLFVAGGIALGRGFVTR